MGILIWKKLYGHPKLTNMFRIVVRWNILIQYLHSNYLIFWQVKVGTSFSWLLNISIITTWFLRLENFVVR
jgi:hypothetical protein